MAGVELIDVAQEDDGIRLDRWFKRHYPALSHGHLAKLLRTGQVRVDGKRAEASLRISAGGQIRVPPLGMPEPGALERAGKPATSTASAKSREEDRRAIADMLLYEDDQVIVLNKPPGLAVQGGSKTTRHVDGMMAAWVERGAEKPRLVHRIDKDTSGILVLAKSAAAAAKLTAAFRHRKARKVYWALVVGCPRILQGKIDAPLLKEGSEDREKVEVNDEGKRAVTLYAVVDHAGMRAAWLALMPLTGRTHQLRAHCALMGTPIAGDRKYGGEGAELPGSLSRKMHLHAREIEIMHPNGGMLKLVAPLPRHMADSWKLFGFDADDRADHFSPEDEI